MAPRRQSALLASKNICMQLGSDEETTTTTTTTRINKIKSRSSPVKVAKKRGPSQDSDASEADDARPCPLPAKRLKKAKAGLTSASASDLHKRLFSTAALGAEQVATAQFPLRQHAVDYHRPLLLQGELGARGRSALLAWYDRVDTDRSMPWRKPFIDPAAYNDKAQLRQALTQRAYEVFISEIMLQQTRVATVIDYWNRWMEKWPTIYDLAKANEDDVMSAWRGLGYYSRCKRILEACKIIVQHPMWDGLMPEDAKELEAKIPGVGPYTAGAISSIVFGRPACMVDGNVLRVLSRQLGLLGDTKTDKAVIDLIWAAARSLVDIVAVEAAPNGQDTDTPAPNNGPGRWGQALMELGSTVCTPNPDCSKCPITMTCRAYQEGVTLSESAGLISETIVSPKLVDIEDLCQICETFSANPPEEPAKLKPAKKLKQQTTLSSFFNPNTPKAPPKTTDKSSRESVSPEALKIITCHAQRFPVKVAKKALREQETLVCAIQRKSDGMYLLQKRPAKGLLAGMWEFPSDILPDSSKSTAVLRKQRARKFVTGLFNLDDDVNAVEVDLEYAGELGSVPWVFSHLKLMMHVHLFQLNSSDEIALADGPCPRRWATPELVEGETMGTGMRQCWKLIAASASWN
ncbi:hypothetical protein N0V82_010532 [Gnomoniopsis sp. IMI 355080]|nr:hypothetical protein N0V82_010532 [Gnomoniopsis sp. IMI 355080]